MLQSWKNLEEMFFHLWSCQPEQQKEPQAASCNTAGHGCQRSGPADCSAPVWLLIVVFFIMNRKTLIFNFVTSHNHIISFKCHRFHVAGVETCLNFDIVHLHAWSADAEMTAQAAACTITDLLDFLIRRDEGLGFSVAEILLFQVPEEWDYCPVLLKYNIIFINGISHHCLTHFSQSNLFGSKSFGRMCFSTNVL